MLSDDAMLGDLEIAAYENRGLLIVPPHTSYNLSENYAEAMITYPPLSEAFRTFYVQHLIKTCCMTGAESLDYLRQLRDQLAQIGGDWESLER